MKPAARRFPLRASRRLKTAVNAVAGWVTVALLRALRFANRQRTANAFGWTMRKAGPWLPEHRVGRANLAAAFPEKSSAEIETILAGVWDNLGRVAAEFAHLHKLQPADPARPGTADLSYDQATADRFAEIHRAGRPTAFFAAHLANWEIPALVGAFFKVDGHVLFRPPNIRAISNAIIRIRAGCMGTLVPSGFDAPVRLANALQRGSHVGMLVDQHDEKGVGVTFFGRPCRANPLLAQLARHLECPIRGVRIIRLPGGNDFWGEITEPIQLARDAEGRVDVQGTMQTITSVVEGWVREHPEQWLWLHRRWR
jgi:KDO2-lipid IV(A) lauroyltransferase